MRFRFRHEFVRRTNPQATRTTNRICARLLSLTLTDVTGHGGCTWALDLPIPIAAATQATVKGTSKMPSSLGPERTNPDRDAGAVSKAQSHSE
jgi:hypothetical protein